MVSADVEQAPPHRLPGVGCRHPVPGRPAAVHPSMDDTPPPPSPPCRAPASDTAAVLSRGADRDGSRIRSTCGLSSATTHVYYVKGPNHSHPPATALEQYPTTSCAGCRRHQTQRAPWRGAEGAPDVRLIIPCCGPAVPLARPQRTNVCVVVLCGALEVHLRLSPAAALATQYHAGRASQLATSGWPQGI